MINPSLKNAAEVLEVHVLDVEHVAVGVLLIVEVVPGVHANFFWNFDFFQLFRMLI